ncbi:hypothetical protein JRO89_XS12G0091800 [Xanthoceras sorbifolium]|uniref:C2H2-type domain-containing protein n=1 Tax=Xanthoceras sorbifolium TaxID=99658 RepID=A0ABQ8HBZ4_9ROSI|nr:hypothetical protein JRO89_XS12G0091800 [Xanthoceras sorbifolium]
MGVEDHALEDDSTSSCYRKTPGQNTAADNVVDMSTDDEVTVNHTVYPVGEDTESEEDEDYNPVSGGWIKNAIEDEVPEDTKSDEDVLLDTVSFDWDNDFMPDGDTDDKSDGAILRAVTALKSREHEKALNFIKESISCHPFLGLLHHSLADNADKDSDAKVKHLEDGVRASQLALELLPNSIHCASLLADLLYQLAFFNEGWERVIEVRKRALKIEDPTVSAIELFGEDVSDESRIEDEKQTIMKWLQDAERKNLEFAAKKSVEAVNSENKEKEDSEVDINHVVMAMDMSKKQLKAIMSDEKKRGFRKVNIEELENHFKLLKYQLAVDLLREAKNFAKQHKTWKFWECCACVKKFGDYESYSEHFRRVHSKILELILISGKEIKKKWIDMILHIVWKPVDTNAVTNSIVDQKKSEKGLDECRSSSVEEVPVKTSKSDNIESSKTFVNDPKWVFCDDLERGQILLRIRSIFDLLLKKKCLALSQVRWVIEYTKVQLESITPLSQFSILDQENIHIICFLGASQLTEVLKLLKDVVHVCGLSENVEMDDPIDDKLSGDQAFDIKERVLYSRDFTSLLLDERILRGKLNVTNYVDAVAGDGSAVTFAADECQNEVLPESDDIVSWLHTGSNCEEGVDSWTSPRHSQSGQAVKFCTIFHEELSLLHKFGVTNAKVVSKWEVIEEVGSMFLEEIKKREKSPEHKAQHFIDILTKWREELQEIDDISIRSKLDVISYVLREAQEVLNCDQSKSEEFCIEDELRTRACIKQADNRIKIILRKLKMQLTKDVGLPIILAFIDGIFLRSVVPMLKAFLQSHLKDLYKDAKERSKAAEEALLAEMALEAEKNYVKQKQDKKKKKKTNKKLRKAMESQATDAGKNLQLHQNDDDNASTELGVSENSDEFEGLIGIEERILEKNLEHLRQIESEAKEKCLEDKNRKMSGRIGENASESVSVSEGCNNARQTQDKKKMKKKKKKFRKAKISKETDGGEQFQHDASPDTELGDFVKSVDKMKKLITKEGIPDENSETQGVSVVCLQHIDYDEYERRLKADIEKAVCLSLGSLKRHYGLLLSTDVNDEPTSRLDVHLYVIVQVVIPDTYAAIRIASRDMSGEVASFSSKKLRPVYDFFQEWLNLESPVDAEFGVSSNACELKHLVTVVRKIVEDLKHERQIRKQAN